MQATINHSGFQALSDEVCSSICFFEGKKDEDCNSVIVESNCESLATFVEVRWLNRMTFLLVLKVQSRKTLL